MVSMLHRLRPPQGLEIVSHVKTTTTTVFCLNKQWALRQVSNAGVTSLCEKCPLLAHLGLASLKHVTDIGVARLGAGCTRLTHLDMSGFVNLSDGMQRDFAFTGIQVLLSPLPRTLESACSFVCLFVL